MKAIAQAAQFAGPAELLRLDVRSRRLPIQPLCLFITAPITVGSMNPPVGSASRALLVVDMQNGFCHQEGSFTRIGMGLEGADEAVRHAAIAVEQARRGGIPVVFTRHLYRPGRADEGRALKQNSPALAGLDGLQAGTWDAEVAAELGWGPPGPHRRQGALRRLPVDLA